MFDLAHVAQVATALVQLRQRNKYQENVVPPWHRYSPQGVYVLGSSVSANTGELGPLYSGPGLAEMADSAKKHARLMVTTAVKVLPYLQALKLFGGFDAL